MSCRMTCLLTDIVETALPLMPAAAAADVAVAALECQVSVSGADAGEA